MRTRLQSYRMAAIAGTVQGGCGIMCEAKYMEDGADYLEEGCQRQTCDGCLAYNYCLMREQEDE